jgi:hypothetical protein
VDRRLKPVEERRDEAADERAAELQVETTVTEPE